jgi:hypothetical protein
MAIITILQLPTYYYFGQVLLAQEPIFTTQLFQLALLLLLLLIRQQTEKLIFSKITTGR